jgi:hypothetical protein
MPGLLVAEEKFLSKVNKRQHPAHFLVARQTSRLFRVKSFLFKQSTIGAFCRLVSNPNNTFDNWRRWRRRSNSHLRGDACIGDWVVDRETGTRRMPAKWHSNC